MSSTKSPLSYAFFAFNVLWLFPWQLSFAGDGHAHGPDGSHISESFTGGNTGQKYIELSPEAEKNLELKTLTIKEQKKAPTKSLFGRVVADPRRVATISAPFQGKVDKVYILPGSAVEKNEELFLTTPIQVGSRPVRLSSPIAGFVTELSTTKGATFEPKDSLAEVSDISHVLFEGDLFDSTNLQQIQKQSECTVITKRYPNKTFQCEVQSVDAVFRGTPPVGHIHAAINNSDIELKPGMSGRMYIAYGEAKQRITIPQSAILGRFENQFVYLKNGTTYTKTAIVVGETFEDQREVTEGLQEGDELVIQGHYQLQFSNSTAPESKNPGASHSHDHGSDHDHSHHDEQEPHSHEHPEKDHQHDRHDHPHDHEGHAHH